MELNMTLYGQDKVKNRVISLGTGTGKALLEFILIEDENDVNVELSTDVDPAILVPIFTVLADSLVAAGYDVFRDVLELEGDDGPDTA